LRKVAAEVGLQDNIRWLGYIPQQELFALYQSMHCLLFPSLHDSSGNIVLEAQANGLPVVCLDLGGPATLVTPETAIVVSTHGKNEASVVRALAHALGILASDEHGRMAIARAGIIHARTNMSWSNRVNGVLKLVEEARCGN